MPFSRIFTERAVERGGHGLRHVGADKSERRGVTRWRKLPRERCKARRRQLPLIARWRRSPAADRPLRRGWRPPPIRRHTGWKIGSRNGPLPAEQPDTSRWRDPDVLG